MLYIECKRLLKNIYRKTLTLIEQQSTNDDFITFSIKNPAKMNKSILLTSHMYQIMKTLTFEQSTIFPLKNHYTGIFL